MGVKIKIRQIGKVLVVLNISVELKRGGGAQ
jgi:hypothetical protein